MARPVDLQIAEGPRRSIRIKFRNPDCKAPQDSAAATDEPTTSFTIEVKLPSAEKGDEPQGLARATESQPTTPLEPQKPATASQKRKRPGPKRTAAPKEPGKKNQAANKKKAAAKRAPKKTASSRKSNKPQQSISQDNAPEELPHNLGSLPALLPEIRVPAVSPNGPDKENQGPNAEIVSNPAANIQPTVDSATTAIVEQKTEDAATKNGKAKRPSYRLTPGNTPFPDWSHPTPEECKVVNDLLSSVHGVVTAPATIPEPSLTVTGCGEVPSVLDALIRTLLSGATTGTNSALAFDGLVKRFGILTEGIGKGSVNWDAVRRASLSDVFEAIKRGGLADIKSKSLKAILDQVYRENQERRTLLLSNDELADDKDPKMSSEKVEKDKEYEIACADQHFLSLNHYHNLSTQEAMTELVKYPGIGPKTAACVILFCLQRPCFAVDTHIFRICKWLDWVPQNANEVTAFSHLDYRLPDEFKYSLHQLFIRHGKSCPRCRAITGEKSAGWEEGCVIDHLVKRTGVRKGAPADPPKKGKANRGVKRKRGAATGRKTTKTKKKKKATTSRAKTMQKKATTSRAKATQKKATGSRSQTTPRKNPPRGAAAKKESTSPTATALKDSSPVVTSASEESLSPPPTSSEDTSPLTDEAAENSSAESTLDESSSATPTPKEPSSRSPTPLEENDTPGESATKENGSTAGTTAIKKTNTSRGRKKKKDAGDEEWSPKTAR